LNPKDKILDDAVKNHDVPFVVAATGDSKGITYAGAAGDATPGRKAGQDTVFQNFLHDQSGWIDCGNDFDRSR
jgi:methyl acetate hydrolase